MNPFEQPPTDPPVSLEPPTPLIQPAPRRGRMVLVAAAAAGLMGAGLIGLSQFASADRPEVTPSASGDTLAVPPPTTEQPDGGDAGDGDNDEGDAAVGGRIDGQIVIDSGDGEPVVIDLGEGTINGEQFDQFSECVGLPILGDEGMFEQFPFEHWEDLPFEEFPLEDWEAMLDEFPFEDLPFEDLEGMLEDLPLGEFGPSGTHVTVIGPDGPMVIEFGDGDGSVTITQRDGELTVDADGSATVTELEQVLGAIELPALDGLDIERLFEEFPFEHFEGMLDEFDDLDDLGQLGGFEFEFGLPTDIQDCLDAIENG